MVRTSARRIHGGKSLEGADVMVGAQRLWLFHVSLYEYSQDPVTSIQDLRAGGLHCLLLPFVALAVPRMDVIITLPVVVVVPCRCLKCGLLIRLTRTLGPVWISGSEPIATIATITTQHRRLVQG